MNKGIRTLLLADTWATFSAGLLGPIYAIFVQEIGGDILDASWAYFAFMITSGVMVYFVSKWEDQINDKSKIIMAGYGISSLGFLSYTFVNSQAMLIVSQIILGIAQAILTPAYDALYSKTLTKNKEASEWGAWESMQYIVTALAAITGGYIAYFIGFKGLFLTMFVISLLAIPTIARMHKD